MPNTSNTTLNLKSNAPTNEYFAIEVLDNPLAISNSITYLQDCLPNGEYLATPFLNDAIKFQSINTAIQFNSVINGRIISLFH